MKKTRTTIAKGMIGFILVGMVATGCGKPVEKAPKTIEHFNMLVVPDLSSRIDDPKPLGDLKVIDLILDRIPGKDGFVCAGRRSIGQKDAYSLSLMNKSLYAKYDFPEDGVGVDLMGFENQIELSDYLYWGTKDGSSLVAKIDEMKLQTEAIYAKALKNDKNRGTDIHAYLNGLTSIDLKMPGEPKSTKCTKHEYRNVIFLITDGYLEKGDNQDKHSKMSVSLTEKMVNKFRDEFTKNGNGRGVEEFFTDEGYGIKPLQNKLLEHTEIIVLEMNDRSADQAGNTPELSDEKILKLFWNNWFKTSGVKAWRLESKVGSKGELNKIIDGVMVKKYNNK